VQDIQQQILGVSKKTGEPNRNRKTGKPETSSGSGLEKPKTGYPGSGTRFLLGTGLNIYFLCFIYIFLIRALDV
jgi:hypothetical protein